MIRLLSLRSLSLLVFFLGWAGSVFAQQKLVILLSKSYGNDTYENWIRRQSPGVQTVSMYHVAKDSVEFWLKKADGFLLTGGEDIYPDRYGKIKDTASCGEFDLRRDTLEVKMLDAAFRQRKPVFGICRGLQLLNIYQGGTLYIDVPTSLGSAVKHRDGGPTHHQVEVKPGTTLAAISKAKSGEITSNHHQGIEKLGKGLSPMAASSDGLVEAIELKTSDYKMFAMAVQWHPERMPEADPLSAPLARAFVAACEMTVKSKR